MRVEDIFHQPPPRDEHPYFEDPVLPMLMKRLLPKSVRATMEFDLKQLGQDLIHHIRPMAPLVQPAKLTQYDQLGRRVDILTTSEGWRQLERLAVEEGYISIAYEREFREYSRIYMFAKTMVMTGDFHVIMCPLGMTDGGAFVIEHFGTVEMKRELLPRLISRDPNNAYLCGQWMTEAIGGSDVSQTETTARATQREPFDLGPPYILDGFKWFSSAAEGNIALALARTGVASDGSRGLSLFVVPLRLPSFPTPLSNGVHMHRLKNKIGTWGVPTAELSLQSTRGWLIGSLNEGVKTISPVLNITRIHSAIHSVGSLQRCLSIARSYSSVRKVDKGTALLNDVPLHVAGLANINLLYRALTHFTFGVIALLGKVECGTASREEESRLRLLTPSVKAFNAEKAPGGMEEAMASLGGLGYMEETGIGRLVRDSLVEKIWEGTANVLALDLRRASQNRDTWATALLSQDIPFPVEPFLMESMTSAIRLLPSIFAESLNNPQLPRHVLNLFSIISCGLFLLEHALWAFKNNEESKHIDKEVFCRWIKEGGLVPLMNTVKELTISPAERSRVDAALVFSGMTQLSKL